MRPQAASPRWPSPAKPSASVLKPMNSPLRFIPYLRPMVWGGRRLQSTLGKLLPTSEPYGESWEVSDHPVHRSIVASGPRAGESLRTLMEGDGDSLLGGAAGSSPTFPWLVKYLDAEDWLSVQVHPDAEAVGRLWPGEGSKTEAWLVLHAEPGSRIYAGLRPGANEAILRAALQSGTVADCLHAYQPQPGDCVFLPAGTVHAVGGGVLIAEVQQTSDATFRLFDWNRRDARGNTRTLHIEEAMAAIDWRQGPVEPMRCAGFPGSGTEAPRAEPHRQSLVRCPYFHLDYLRSSTPFSCGGEGRLGLLMVLHGSGAIDTPREAERLALGQSWLLPAAMPRHECRPAGTLHALLATLPDPVRKGGREL
jgi:mannose-6-phosphate isomerase